MSCEAQGLRVLGAAERVREERRGKERGRRDFVKIMSECVVRVWVYNVWWKW